jgi:crotonobetainyl-CoA:carnitine CoA-transferase CaiB-like acyl-CoA transferase
MPRDARYATEEARAAHAPSLAQAIGAELAKRSAGELEAALTSRGIACVRADVGPCRRWLFDQDWARTEQLVVETPESQIGPYLRYGPPLLSDRPVRLGGAYPSGRDTRTLLVELGYGEQEIGALFAQGIVAEPRPSAS